MPDCEIRTILLIDGGASAFIYFAMLLRHLENKVVIARSGEDALNTMEGSVPSIVLTELSLPRMSGIQSLGQVKQSERFKAILFVILTSENDPEIKEACIRMGCAAFLGKPAYPDALYRVLQSASGSLPRANIRLQTSLKVIIGDDSPAGGAKRTEFSTAISEGGLYIRTCYSQPTNALTSLRIIIRDGEIKARAVVLYSYAQVEGPFKEPGMGMRSVEISDEDRSHIREQLTGNLDRPEKEAVR